MKKTYDTKRIVPLKKLGYTSPKNNYHFYDERTKRVLKTAQWTLIFAGNGPHA